MGHTFIPAPRQRVRMRGRAGVYFVLAVDHEAEMAYVINVDTDREADSFVETVRFVKLAPLESEAGDQLGAA